MSLVEGLRVVSNLEHKFAVVKKGQREVGMIGERSIKDVLE